MLMDVARAAAAVETELDSLLEDGSVGSAEDDGTSSEVVAEASDEGTTTVVVPDAAGPEGAAPEVGCSGRGSITLVVCAGGGLPGPTEAAGGA